MTTPPITTPAPGDFWKLRAWLKSMNLSYTTYRRLRAQGKMPTEIRLSQRTILISKQAIAEWRMQEEAPAAQAGIIAG